MNFWDDVRIFLAVARHGGYSQAARQLRLVQTTIGRRVASLEARMGAKLFLRTQTGMQLTARGAQLAEAASGMERAARLVEHHMARGDHPLKGPVSIKATDGLAAYWLIPRLAEFEAAYPDIRIEIVDVSSWSGLLTADSELVLRYTPAPRSQLVSRKIGRTQFALFAARAYLDRTGRPRRLQDLQRHRLVENFNFRNNPSLHAWTGILSAHAATLRVNSTAALLSAVRSACGIALLPRFYVSSAPELVEIELPVRPICDTWLLAHPDTLNLPRVAAVATFVAQKFQEEESDWSDGWAATPVSARGKRLVRARRS